MTRRSDLLLWRGIAGHFKCSSRSPSTPSSEATSDRYIKTPTTTANFIEAITYRDKHITRILKKIYSLDIIHQKQCRRQHFDDHHDHENR
jgi:hypothetical protein